MKNIREFLENFTEEEIQKKNQEQIKENEELYEEFKDAYSKNCCSLCGNKIDSFNKIEPCFHWFLLPKGIRKKDFDNYLKDSIGYFNLESYFRWVANLENPIKSINDLSSEISKSKFKEITISYKNIEWSLTIGVTDLDGHKDSKNANFPHFHLQMLIDNKPFINFNDYHIPFSKEDLFNFKLLKEVPDLVEFRDDNGAGMSFIEDSENLEEFLKIMKVAENNDNALLRSRTIVQRSNGETMPSHILQKIVEESKETKIPMRNLFVKYFPDAKTVTEILPGKGVPEMKKRIPRNKNK